MPVMFNAAEEAVIHARVASARYGLQEYDHVSFIRIKSRRYTLLILKEYMPVIGEIEGSITISRNGLETVYEGVKGYFMHSNNDFSLMLENTPDSSLRTVQGE